METDPLIGHDHERDALRDRRININDDIDVAPKTKCSWKSTLIVLIILAIAGLLLAVFLPHRLKSYDNQDSIFGGMYTVALNSDYNVNNHYTSDITCPDGYSAKIGINSAPSKK